MSSGLKESSVIRRFEHNNAIKICDGIIFDFYMGLPHILLFCYISNYLSSGMSSHEINSHEYNSHEMYSYEINSHKINSHEINSHEINLHKINFSCGQLTPDQLSMWSTQHTLPNVPEYGLNILKSKINEILSFIWALTCLSGLQTSAWSKLPSLTGN